MTDITRVELVARDAIVKLLSDEETAKVSTAEAAISIAEGAEYLDLQHIDQGIQRANAAIKVTLPHIVPRSAVSGGTWKKILAHLAH